MSNTPKTFVNRPYFNSRVEEELAREDEEMVAAQKPDAEDSDHDTGNSDTQNADSQATSDDKESTYEKRWKDLKKHYDQEVTSLRQQLRELQDTNDFVAPKTEEELQAFRQKYPEFYDVILSVAYEHGKKFGEKTSSRVEDLEKRLFEAEQEKAFKEIEKAHPDYLETVYSDEFMTWLDEQDTVIQSWVKENSNNAGNFIRTLDLYKLDKGIVKTAPKRKASGSNNSSASSSAAEAVSTGSSVSVGDTGKRVWSKAEISKMSDKDFEKYEEEIMQAMVEGRIH